MKKLSKFFRNLEAATMFEYCQTLTLFVIVFIIAVTAVGTGANAVFTQIAASLNGV